MTLAVDHFGFRSERMARGVEASGLPQAHRIARERLESIMHDAGP